MGDSGRVHLTRPLSAVHRAAAGLVVAGLFTSCGPAPSGAIGSGSHEEAGPAVRDLGVDPPGRAILRAWDAARAEAYAAGSAADLARLYEGDAGAADVRLLRDYLDRGLRVDQMEVQVLGLEVLSSGAGECRLRVTDRLRRAVAVGAEHRTALPRDEPSTRVVRFVRRDGGWLVADVRAVSDRAPR